MIKKTKIEGMSSMKVGVTSDWKFYNKVTNDE